MKLKRILFQEDEGLVYGEIDNDNEEILSKKHETVLPKSLEANKSIPPSENNEEVIVPDFEHVDSNNLEVKEESSPTNSSVNQDKSVPNDKEDENAFEIFGDSNSEDEDGDFSLAGLESLMPLKTSYLKDTEKNLESLLNIPGLYIF